MFWQSQWPDLFFAGMMKQDGSLLFGSYSVINRYWMVLTGGGGFQGE